MSAKGCSPDNEAAEGFPGRLKQEFFRERSFTGVSMDGFIDTPDDYMTWHRDRRIKTESRRGHHGPAQDAGACGMIGDGGINDESNKTSPAPHLRVTWFWPFSQAPMQSAIPKKPTPYRTETSHREESVHNAFLREDHPS